MNRVFLIEADERLSKNIAKRLGIVHCSVDIYHDPKEALQAFIEHVPDVVVTEIDLPNGGGLDMIRQMHACNSACEIIVFTRVDAVNRADLLKLLRPKRRATESRDHLFEEILLDTGRSCDERIRDGADMVILEEFSSIITYFDRYDATSSAISKIAFMENVRISEDMLRSFLGAKREFDALQEGFFEELFITDLFSDRYLGKYGRSKIAILMKGLALIEENRMTMGALLEQLQAVDREESLF